MTIPKQDELRNELDEQAEEDTKQKVSNLQQDKSKKEKKKNKNQALHQGNRNNWIEQDDKNGDDMNQQASHRDSQDDSKKNRESDSSKCQSKKVNSCRLATY